MSTKFSILISLLIMFIFTLSPTLIAIATPGEWAVWRVSLLALAINIMIFPLSFVMAKTYPG